MEQLRVSRRGVEGSKVPSPGASRYSDKGVCCRGDEPGGHCLGFTR